MNFSKIKIVFFKDVAGLLQKDKPFFRKDIQPNNMLKYFLKPPWHQLHFHIPVMLTASVLMCISLI